MVRVPREEPDQAPGGEQDGPDQAVRDDPDQAVRDCGVDAPADRLILILQKLTAIKDKFIKSLSWVVKSLSWVAIFLFLFLSQALGLSFLTEKYSADPERSSIIDRRAIIWSVGAIFSIVGWILELHIPREWRRRRFGFACLSAFLMMCFDCVGTASLFHIKVDRLRVAMALLSTSFHELLFALGS